MSDKEKYCYEELKKIKFFKENKNLIKVHLISRVEKEKLFDSKNLKDFNPVRDIKAKSDPTISENFGSGENIGEGIYQDLFVNEYVQINAMNVDLTNDDSTFHTTNICNDFSEEEENAIKDIINLIRLIDTEKQRKNVFEDYVKFLNE